MKKTLLVFAFLLIACSSAYAGFGIGAHYEYHPFFLDEKFQWKISPNWDGSRDGTLDVTDLAWHSVYLGLGRNYQAGFVDFIVGYERLEGSFDENHFDDLFHWDYLGLGIHGGGLIPLIDFLRLQVAAEATLGFGQYNVPDSDIISDFAWGGTIGGDLELRFYPGGPARDKPPTGFFVGAGLGFKYVYRQAFDNDEGWIDTANYRFRGWTIGFTIVHIGFGS